MSNRINNTVLPSKQTKYPMSYSQRQMWFLEESSSKRVSHFSGSVLSFEGPLDFISLQQAMNEIIKRHEILRTCYLGDNEQVSQVVHPASPVNIEKHDLSEQSHFIQKQQEHEIISTLLTHPINLAVDSVLRTCLIRRHKLHHVLFFGIHHIASDGWSIVIFMRELCEFYNAFRIGRRPRIKPLSVQYHNYSVYQYEKSRQSAHQKSAKFWLSKLENSPELLNIPTDFPRKTLQDYRGEYVPIELSTELSLSIRKYARDKKTTPYCVLLSGYQSALYKITSVSDILVGGPVITRDDEQWAGLIGMFINTLVYRANISNHTTFSHLIDYNTQYLIESIEHRHYPFEALVHALQPIRTPSFLPVIQTMLSLIRGEKMDLSFDELKVTDKPWIQPASKFDIVLNLFDKKGGDISGNLEYDASLFTSKTAIQIVKILHQILQSAISNWDTPIAKLSVLDGNEESRLLTHWCGQVNPYVKMNVHHLFESMCQKYGDKCAIIYEDIELSYAELNQMSDRITGFLAQRGVGNNNLVGVAMDRSIEVVPVLLAILKCGATYVPIDSELPQEQISRIVELADIKLIVTDASLTKALPDDVILVTITDILNSTGNENNISISSNVDVGSAAYVMFTSGSSGAPKGVVIPHAGIVRLVTGQASIQPTERDVILQYAPMSFDASTFEIWGALLNGATLAIAPAGKLGISTLFEYVQTKQVNKLWLTADMFELTVVENIDFFDNLEQVITGGDIVSPFAVKKFVDRFDSKHLICAYGPTENTTFSCYFEVPEDINNNSALPIGKPISGTQVYVMDEHFQLLPVGVVGELFLGGQGLAIEYIGQQELTKAAFIEVQGIGRLYRTGDRARWNHDGLLEFFGRLDNQVKIRGFRVELSGIDSIISRFDGVDDCVTVCDVSRRYKRLISFVRSISLQSQESIDSLKYKLRDQLPTYMIPDQIIVLEKFPYLINGKLDRFSLLKLIPSSTLDKPKNTPLTDIQKELCDIWAAVLGLKKVTDIYIDFFSLGGNSLLAAKLIFRIEKQFDLKLPLESLFKQNTISQFSELIEKGRQEIDESKYNMSTFEEAPKSYDLFHKMRSFISGWNGFREKDTSLIVQIGNLHSPQTIFWCGQDSGEFTLISENLKHRYRVCGMRSPRWLKNIDTSLINTIASRYVNEMIKIMPSGPFYLYGFCLGSAVITAASQILLNLGRQVAHITLIEGLHHTLINSPPINAPTTLIFAKEGELNPYKKFKTPDMFYGRLFSGRYSVKLLPTDHNNIIRSKSSVQISNLILKHLQSEPMTKAKQSNLNELVLQRTAYQSCIELTKNFAIPMVCRSMQTKSIQISVTNTSDVHWNNTQAKGVFVYDKWMCPSRRVVSWGTNPQSIGTGLAPNESITMEMTVTAPSRPGPYTLALHLVIEGVTFFSDRRQLDDSKNSKDCLISCDVINNKSENSSQEQNYSVLLKTAEHYYDNGDYINCVEACSTVIHQEYCPGLEFFKMYAISAMKSNDSIQAKSASRLGLKIEPFNRKLKLIYLHSVFCLDEHNKCFPLIDDYMKRSDHTAKELSKLSEICVNLQLSDKAMYFIQLYIDQDPNSIDTLNESAEYLYKLGKYNFALNTCEKGLQLNFSDPLTYQVKAKVLYSLQKFDLAIETLDSALILDADSYQTYKWLVKCYLAKHDIPQAKQIRDEAKNINQSWHQLDKLLFNYDS